MRCCRTKFCVYISLPVSAHPTLPRRLVAVTAVTERCPHFRFSAKLFLRTTLLKSYKNSLRHTIVCICQTGKTVVKRMFQALEVTASKRQSWNIKEGSSGSQQHVLECCPPAPPVSLHPRVRANDPSHTLICKLLLLFISGKYKSVWASRINWQKSTEELGWQNEQREKSN